MKIKLAIIPIIAMLLTMLPTTMQDASADGDGYCESGEVCLFAYYSDIGWLIWSEPGNEHYYYTRTYDTPDGSIAYLDNNSSWVRNKGQSCTVYLSAEPVGIGKRATVERGVTTYFGWTDIGVNRASAHNWCTPFF